MRSEHFEFQRLPQGSFEGAFVHSKNADMGSRLAHCEYQKLIRKFTL